MEGVAVILPVALMRVSTCALNSAPRNMKNDRNECDENWPASSWHIIAAENSLRRV